MLGRSPSAIEGSDESDGAICEPDGADASEPAGRRGRRDHGEHLISAPDEPAEACGGALLGAPGLDQRGGRCAEVHRRGDELSPQRPAPKARPKGSTGGRANQGILPANHGLDQDTVAHRGGAFPGEGLEGPAVGAELPGVETPRSAVSAPIARG